MVPHRSSSSEDAYLTNMPTMVSFVNSKINNVPVTVKPALVVSFAPSEYTVSRRSLRFEDRSSSNHNNASESKSAEESSSSNEDEEAGTETDNVVGDALQVPVSEDEYRYFAPFRLPDDDDSVLEDSIEAIADNVDDIDDDDVDVDVEVGSSERGGPLNTSALTECSCLPHDNEIVEVTVTKESVGSKLGISLKEFEGKIIVSAIQPDSLFRETELKVGRTVLSVNGTSCHDLTNVEAIALFQTAESVITVRAQENGLLGETARDTHVGVSFRDIRGALIVTSICDSSLFADTCIVPGVQLLAVNNVWWCGVNNSDTHNNNNNNSSTTTTALAQASSMRAMTHALEQAAAAHTPVTVLARRVPGYVSGTVTKDSVDAKVGIALQQYKDDIVINSIDEEGLFHYTKLRPGLRLMCVNGTLVAGLTRKEALALFKQAEGPVTVLAEPVDGLLVGSAVKETAESKVGISLKDYNGQILVSNISENGIFSGSPITVGLKLVSVNKTDVTHMKKNQAIGLFKGAEGKFWVVAEKIESLAVASVQKESVTSKVGLTLRQFSGDFFITSIAKGGLFDGSELSCGLKLISVNKKDTSTLTQGELMKLFSEAQGNLSVLAENTSLVVASATKEKAATKVGITLTEDFKGNVVISSVSDKGIFADSAIKAGQKVVKVNQTDVSGLTNNETIELIKEANGKVSIVAETIGIVVATASKTSTVSKVGIALTEYDYKGALVINRVSNAGIFAGSAIKPGLILVSVNNTDVSGMTKYEAIGLFKDAPDNVTIVAKDIGLVVETASKRREKRKVGISLNEYDRTIVITKISKKSIFASSGLKVGMVLVNVNNTDVTGMTKFQAIRLFKGIKGEISVMARDSSPTGKSSEMDSEDSFTEIEDLSNSSSGEGENLDSSSNSFSERSQNSLSAMSQEEASIVFKDTVGELCFDV